MFAVTAGAASLQYQLELSNESQAFPAGTPYLNVTISDGANGAIDFKVTTTEALSSLADSNYGIQSFSFNFGSSGATTSNLQLPDGWSVQGGSQPTSSVQSKTKFKSYANYRSRRAVDFVVPSLNRTKFASQSGLSKKASTRAQASAGSFFKRASTSLAKSTGSSHSIFGKFDTTIKGTGSSRLDPLMFSIVGIDGDTPEDYVTKLSSGGEYDVLFAAHVAGFKLQVKGEEFDRVLSSAQFGGGSSVVPLPPAVWLLGSGLSVLGLMRRRRGNNAVAVDA